MAITVGSILIEPMDVTWNSNDLGATTGGVEVSFTEDLVDVSPDQVGTQIMSQIRTGNAVEISMSIQEMTATRWNQMFADGGGADLTPSMGTEVSGYGSSKKFSQTLTEAAELQLKPVGAADDARNLHFFKAYPVPESISFGGEDVQAMSVTFRVYPDSTKDSAVDLFVFGDGTQDLS